MRNPVIFDLVVDLAAPVPRIASLRDVTGFEVGVRLLGARYEELDSGNFERPEASSEEDLDEDQLFPSGDSAFDESSFLDDFESAFEQPSPLGDFESAFDRDEPSSEETTEGPGSAQADGTASSSGGAGPRGRWSPR